MALKGTTPRYSGEEIARRGDRLYAQDIQPHLASHDTGKFLAIDVETGEYEMSDNQLEASDKLRARQPDAQIWYVRVGYDYVHSFGGRRLRSAP